MIIALSEKLNSSPMILGCADIRLSSLHSGSGRASQPLWLTLKNRKLRSVTLRCKTFLYIFQLCKFNYPSGKQQMETILKLNCVFNILRHQSQELYQYLTTRKRFSMKFQGPSSKDPSYSTTWTESRCSSPRAAPSTRSRTHTRTSLPGKSPPEPSNTLSSTCSLFIISTFGGYPCTWSTICSSIGNIKRQANLRLKK